MPAYSPYTVAERTIALMLALNRKLHRAYNRVRKANFALDGLLGFDMHGKTVGVIGTVQIGSVVAQIVTGLGSRGALLDTLAIIQKLKSGKIGYLGLDVYEEEEQIFFEDRLGLILSDDVFARLFTFPNVIITGHQAFFTREALLNIAATTIDNISRFENGQPVERLAG